MARSRPYHHGDLRSALLASSLALIRQRGPQGFTLRQVARRAGVSHTAPYRHFRDRSDLLAAVAEEGFVRLKMLVQAATSKIQGPIERLQAAGLSYVKFALDEPDQFRVMFSIELNSETHPSAGEAARQAFDELLGIVNDCQRSGLIRSYEPLTAARICWAHVHGIAELGVQRQVAFKDKKEMLEFASVAIGSLQTGLMR